MDQDLSEEQNPEEESPQESGESGLGDTIKEEAKERLKEEAWQEMKRRWQQELAKRAARKAAEKAAQEVAKAGVKAAADVGSKAVVSGGFFSGLLAFFATPPGWVVLAILIVGAIIVFIVIPILIATDVIVLPGVNDSDNATVTNTTSFLFNFFINIFIV